MTKYKLLSTDLDGTVFGKNTTLSARNLAAVHALRAAGVYLCINTGRLYTTAMPHAESMGLDTLMGLCQGAAVMKAGTGEVVSSSPLSLALSREVLMYAQQRLVYAQVYTPYEYYSDTANRFSAFYEALAGRPAVNVGSKTLLDFLDFEPLKVLFVADPEDIRHMYTELSERFAGRISITLSKAEYLEFNALNATKGNALATMASYYGIGMDETAAIGDELNDVSMLSAAGLGIAVGSASEEVQRRADVVCAPMAEDGFADAVYRYILDA